jgi:hypothetical protein
MTLDRGSRVAERHWRIDRGYARVIVIWVLVLAALYAFQEYFS